MRRGFRRAAQILAVGVFGALAACASSDQSLSDRLAGADRVQGDADGVSVFKTDSVADALPLAVGHCAKFHRSAQYASRNGDTIKFRCVVEPASG